jgi:hypothetical protein
MKANIIMGTHKRSKSQVNRDRRKISSLYLQGVGQWEIGERLGISQPTVSRDLKVIQTEWRERNLEDIGELKRVELEKIDHLEQTYWDAWQRSIEDAETIRQEGEAGAAGGSNVKPKKIVRTAKGQIGDPRFLAGVQWCINKRADILGIDAPKKVENRLTMDVTKMSDEELKQLASGR